MGPVSMPSVPLMVGCGVSCTALLILLFIYAAFWRYTLVLRLYLFSNVAPKVPKPQRGLMRNKCSIKVDYFSVARMTDGEIKLITSHWSQMLFTPSSLAELLTTHVHHSHLTLFLSQVHPFGEIHHLGEFLPLHLGLQSIDFGRTISNVEQGEAPGASVLCIVD